MASEAKNSVQVVHYFCICTASCSIFAFTFKNSRFAMLENYGNAAPSIAVKLTKLYNTHDNKTNHAAICAANYARRH